MSALIIAHDSHLMMLEVGVDKLFIPNATRFDDVVLSKSIVSFRFLDDDWIDIMPNRLDYRKYRGSAGSEQRFYGGKSVVFSVTSALLTEESSEESSEECSEESSTDKCLEIAVRREISPYFEVDKHVCEFGSVWIDVCELFNGIVEELKTRRELNGYLSLAHERDPISRSTKGHYNLEDPDTCDPTDCNLDIYVRLSYLGDSIITEIDRPLPRDPCAPFYAQEEKNLAPPYECIELNPSIVTPICKVPVLTKARCHDLECTCTDEQRCRLMLADNMKNVGTCPMTTDGDDKNGKSKASKKKSDANKKDQSTGTGAEVDDKSCATDTVCKMGEVARGGKCEPKRKPRTKLTAEDLANLLAANRRGAMISVGIVDKAKPCEPCVPCTPCVIETPCIEVCPRPVCPSTYPCPPPVYCYD